MSKAIQQRLEAAQAKLFEVFVVRDVADNDADCGFRCDLCEQGDGDAPEGIAHLPHCPLYDYVPARIVEAKPVSFSELVRGRAFFANADCMDALRALAAEGVRFDSAVFDPPYHYDSIVKRFGNVNAARAKNADYDRISKNFVGMNWDGGDLIFRPEVWRLISAVMKPGAYVAAFAADKFYHRMACAMEAAGFIPVRMASWLYGSGRLKIKDIAKMVAKKYGPERARAYEGWATDIKVAMEPIAIFRKKVDGNFAHNAVAHGCGGLNIMAAAVPVESDHDPRQTALIDMEAPEQMTRFPSNVVHDGSAEVEEAFAFFGEAGASTPPQGGGKFYGDKGTPSRFFYSAKPAKSEKGGTDHPTVKKLELMEWLIRLVTPRGGMVLDPFAGTGTTGVACLRQGFGCYMVEREAKYAADLAGRLVAISGADTPLFSAGP